MTENLRRFNETVKANEELQRKLESLGEEPTFDQIIAVAAEHGITLTPEDFESAEAKELSDAELDDVAGGYGQTMRCKICQKRISGGALGMTLHRILAH